MLEADTKPRRFKVGDKVRITKAPSGHPVEAFLDRFRAANPVERQDEVCEVLRLRPADDFGYQYHVRPLAGGPERLVHEDQLAAVG